MPSQLPNATIGKTTCSKYFANLKRDWTWAFISTPKTSIDPYQSKETDLMAPSHVKVWPKWANSIKNKETILLKVWELHLYRVPRFKSSRRSWRVWCALSSSQRNWDIQHHWQTLGLKIRVTGSSKGFKTRALLTLWLIKRSPKARSELAENLQLRRFLQPWGIEERPM